MQHQKELKSICIEMITVIPDVLIFASVLGSLWRFQGWLLYLFDENNRNVLIQGVTLLNQS